MTYRRGDRCFFVEIDGRLCVQHVDCDQHRDGVVTDCRTLDVVTRFPAAT